MKDPIYERMRGRRRAMGGSVLILTLIFSTVVVTTILTFGRSVRNQVKIASEVNSSLDAELAAQSGIEYAMRHLLEDPEWLGSGRMLLTSEVSFEVKRLKTTPLGPVSTLVELTSEGFAKGAQYRLEVEMQVNHGDPLANQALASLGGSVTLHNSAQDGDMMIIDELDRVWDYYPSLNGGEGGWQIGGPSEVASFDFSSNNSTGTLWKYTDTLYSGFDKQLVNTQDIYMPAWDLDPYLEQGSDRVHYVNPNSLSNTEHEETVVVVLKPNTKLVLEDVKLHGGLVIHLAGDYPYRDGPRNLVVMKGQNIIGGGTNGVHENVGFIAPGCHVRGNSAYVHGFSMWNEAFTSIQVESMGSLLVINDIKNMNGASTTWDPSVASDPPPGVTFHGGEPSVDVLMVRESYSAPAP